MNVYDYNNTELTKLFVASTITSHGFVLAKNDRDFFTVITHKDGLAQAWREFSGGYKGPLNDAVAVGFYKPRAGMDLQDVLENTVRMNQDEFSEMILQEILRNFKYVGAKLVVELDEAMKAAIFEG